MARGQGPLQADRARRLLGHYPAAVYDVDLQPVFWKTGEGSLRPHSLPAFLPGWVGTLDFFCEWTFASLQQPDHKLKLDFKGLLSALDFTTIGGDVGRHRFRDLLCAAGWHDGLLSPDSDPSLHLSAAVLPACIRNGTRCRPVAFRAQRGVSRRAIYDSIPDTVLDVCYANCIPVQPAQ